jgi:uncharacterized protein (DUF1501 family)
MRQDGLRRRDVLMSAAAVSAVAALGSGLTARAADDPRAFIDQVLRGAVDTKEVPGVVAMAASDKGIL